MRARSPRRKLPRCHRAARWSASRNPALCRVSTYSWPGLPSPTMASRGSGLLVCLALAFGLGLRLANELRLGDRDLFGRGDGSLLGPRRHHGADRGVGVVEDGELLRLDVAHEERVPDGQRGDVEVDVLGDVGRQDLDLQLAQRVVEHAAEVPDAVRDADQADGHLERDGFVGPDLVEVEVDDVARAERVPLDLADERPHAGPAFY